MFKKYFQFEKTPGFTDIFAIVKYNNFLDNEKFIIPVNNTNPVGHSVIDITTSNFVFFCKEIHHVATIDFVLSCSIDQSYSSFSNVMPIPLKHILKTKYDKYMSDLKSKNSNCYIEIFQRYKKYEK